MEKIYDTLKKGMSFYDAFKDVLDKQKAHDLIYIKNAYKDGYEEDKIDQVYREYEMNITKLEYVENLSTLDELSQRRFTKEYLHIDSLDLDNGRKIETILSIAVLFSKNPVLAGSLSDEELYLVGTLFTSIPSSELDSSILDQYDLYMPIICNNSLLKEVINKTSDMNVRRDILRDILDLCDYRVASNMNNDEYKSIIKNSLELVNNYKIKNKTSEIHHKVA